MYTLNQAQPTSDLQRFCQIPGLPPLSPQALYRPPADAHLVVADSAGSDVGRCSLWWSATPAYSAQEVGLIGHYAARDREAAAQLLERACEMLAAQGCTLAIGPMDGNAWQRYRLVVERGSRPPFLLEPNNPDDWPAHFVEQGFDVLAHYTSAITSNLEQRNPRRAELEEQAAARGIAIRRLRAGDFDAELRRIYNVAVRSFCNNLLYSPISEEDFLAQYGAMRQYVRPELVLLAEQDEQTIGFVFAIPDLLQAQRGQQIDTVVIKTLAVLPEYGGVGLGSLLVDRCQEAAALFDYRSAIHALMHEENSSRRISRHYAQTIRRYALYAREL